MSTLVSSLWITLIGMVLIFASVLLLWGLMEVLMRFTARYAAKESEEGSPEGDEEIGASAVEAIAPPVTDQKKRAAVAAVAIALSLRRPAAHAAPKLSTGSAWQAVNRSSLLNNPTHIIRKSRGSVR